MNPLTDKNPFELLQLPSSAETEEVLQQAARLKQRSTDEAVIADIRRAVQALTGPEEERRLHAACTYPGACFQQPNLQRFLSPYRRPPRIPATPDCPPLDLDEFDAILRLVLAEELQLSPQPLEPLDTSDPPEEIDRQSAEAILGCLPFEMEGT